MLKVFESMLALSSAIWAYYCDIVYRTFSLRSSSARKA
jgi:hypothetical protein